MSWQTARGYCWSRALRLLRERAGTTLLAVLISGMALAVLVVAFVATQAIGALPLNQPVAEVSIFIAPGTGAADAKALATRIGALDGVANARLLSGEQAWSDLQRRAKDAQKLPEPRAGALPDMVIAEFAPRTAPAVIEAAVAASTKLARVESVQAELGWYRRLFALWQTATAIAPAAAIVTAVLLLSVVLGAVRLTTRLDPGELRVLDQIGADQDFIRRPGVYAGAVVLLLAGAVALGLAGLARSSVAPFAAELGRAFGLEFMLAVPPWPLLISFMAACVLTGAVSGYYFAGRSMRQAEQ